MDRVKKKHKRHRGESPQSSDSYDRHKKRLDHRQEEYSRDFSSDDSESRHKKYHKQHNDRPKKNKHSRQQESDSNSQSDNDDSIHRQHSHRHRSDRNASDGEEERKPRHHKKRRHHRDEGGREEQVRYDPNMKIKKERDNFEKQERERSIHDQRRRENRRERERRGGDFGMNRDVPVKQENRADWEMKQEAPPPEQPNMELSGKLTEDTNTFRGVVIKYNEPQEAMIPKRKWRLYPFKGDQSLGVLHIHRQSAYLMGRDRKICEIALDHPSSSKQHAVLQYRAVPYTRPDGSEGRRVRPYIIDLESANGTYVNGDRIEGKRYHELREKDVLKFAYSTREFVLLHDKVDTSELGNEDLEEV